MPLPTTSLLGLVATSHAIGNGVAGACEPFCADTPCTSLNGDIFTECGGAALALEVASCVVHADVGDVLLLHPDVFHRTQDMAVSRLALLAEAM